MKPKADPAFWRFGNLLFVLALAAASTIASPLKKPGWQLTFDDEFNGRKLDLKKWNPQDPWGQERNQELEAYITNAFTVKHGVLHIETKKAEAFYSGKERSITSGIMTTLGKFSQEYGWFEIRCRVPKGKGMWPAFWLLPDTLQWPPEIDVLEILGHEPDKVYTTQHYLDAQGKHQKAAGHWIGPDFSAGFHDFAIEWSPERIIWYVDGVERFRSDKTIPHEKMYMLVNLAVGGFWPGPPDGQTRFPASFDVDYIRVYKKLP